MASTVRSSRPHEALAGHADSGIPGGGRVTFWEGCDRAPGPWTAVSYAELPPGGTEAGKGHGTERVLLAVAGSGLVTADGEQHQASAGDALTCPAGAACGIRVPEGAGQPLALLAVGALPGSPQRRSQPTRVPLAGRMSWCAGYRGGGCDQETLVAVTRLDPYLTGRWARLSLIEVEPAGILGEWHAGQAAGYRRPYDSSEVLFTVSGVAEVTADAVTTENKDRPGRRLCVGVPPSGTVLVRNLSHEQPLLLASIEMGVPA